MARLTDITVLVTGAATALGTATIGRLVGEGASVIASEHNAKDARAPSEALSERFGNYIEVLDIDVTDPTSWEAAAESISASHGILHGLVNNATSVRTGALTSMDPDDVRKMIEVNMLGPALGIRTMAPLLGSSGGGSIVNIASTEAMRGAREAAVFAATNWGLRGLTRSAALELGPQGIRVNTVCPSTGLMHGAVTGADRDGSGSVLADGGQARPVTMGDVAAMVTFLLSDDSATCTGGDFLVDAGSAAGESL